MNLLLFGHIVKKRRKELGWTLDEMAARAEYSIGYLSKLERGKAQNPSTDCINRLARVLTLDPVTVAQQINDDEIRSIEDVANNRSTVVPLTAELENIVSKGIGNNRGLRSENDKSLIRTLTSMGSGNTVFLLGEENEGFHKRSVDAVKLFSSRQVLPPEVNEAREAVAKGYRHLGESFCRCSAEPQDKEHLYHQALSSYSLAETICEDLPPSGSIELLQIQIWYDMARTYQSLGKIEYLTSNLRLVYFFRALEYCEMSYSAVMERRLESDEFKALAPACASISGYLYGRISRDMQRLCEATIGNADSSVAQKKHLLESLSSKQDGLAIACMQKRVEAERLYLDWIKELDARPSNISRDSRLAEAYYRLAIFYRGIEMTKESPLESNYDKSLSNLVAAIKLRWSLARSSGPTDAEQLRELARYHFEFAETLQYWRSKERYARAMWHYHVAGYIHPDFLSENNPYAQAQLSALIYNETELSSMVVTMTNQSVQELLEASNFDSLDYPLDYPQFIDGKIED